MAVAALVGASAITGVLVWSPQQGDASSVLSTLHSQLRDDVLQLLQSRGLAWIIQSSPTDLCGELAALSNSSVSFTAVLGSYSCSQSAPPGATSSSITFRLLPLAVTLEAWSSAQG